MNKTKIYSLLLLTLFGANAFGMEQDSSNFNENNQNKDEDVAKKSDVSTLQDLACKCCIDKKLY